VSTKGRAAALIVLSVFFGFVIGAIGDHLFFVHGHRPPLRHTPEMDARFIGLLDQKLDLSPAQKQQIAVVLKRSAEDFDRLFRETSPRIRARMLQQNREIEQVLTPAQRETFRKMKPPGPGPGGPRPRGPGGPPPDGPPPAESR
jgi:Spy/CpxP family protein refolding chaperone